MLVEELAGYLAHYRLLPSLGHRYQVLCLLDPADIELLGTMQVCKHRCVYRSCFFTGVRFNAHSRCHANGLCEIFDDGQASWR
jgi:hypothetical protein